MQYIAFDTSFSSIMQFACAHTTIT